jgi:chorismate dehydratase
MKVKTAIVSYHNTLPFLYAIQNSVLKDKLELVLTPPSQCAALYHEGKVDLALVPIGALHELQDYNLLSNTCIGSDGEVFTVAIFSNKPIENCSFLYLDSDSRTSNDLAKILLSQHFKLNLEIKGKLKFPLELEANGAYILIGDKVFEYESSFRYKYDLGKLWKEFTGLPFAFAVWIARNSVNKDLVSEIVSVLNNMNFDTIENRQIGPNVSLHQYLNDYISFDFSPEKREAMNKFLAYQHELNVINSSVV